MGCSESQLVDGWLRLYRESFITIERQLDQVFRSHQCGSRGCWQCGCEHSLQHCCRLWRSGRRGLTGFWHQIVKRVMAVFKLLHVATSASIRIVWQRRGSLEVLFQRKLTGLVSLQQFLLSFVLTSSRSWFATSQ